MNWFEKIIDGMCGKKDESTQGGEAPPFPEFPTPHSVKTIGSTMIIHGSKDFNGMGIVCKGMGDGSQKEGQRPALKVKGGTVSDLVLLAPGVDGIYVKGKTTLRGIVWDDIGEDGFTLHGTNVTLESCIARKGADKWGQINGPDKASTITIHLKNCSIEDVQRVIRLNGGGNARPHTLKLYIDGCHFKNCRTIARASTGKCYVEFKNTVFENIREPWQGCAVKDKGGNRFINTKH